MKFGWKLINNKWYYLGDKNDGSMKSGWQLIDNEWYYLGEQADGSMKTGWIQTNGIWYFLTDNGQMARNTWIDSYYVDGSGAWVR